MAALLAIAILTGCDLKQTPDHNSEPRLHVYEFGQPIPFGLGGDDHRFALSGWSEPESGFTWSDGIGASLMLRVPATNTPLTLRMKQWAFTHPPADLLFQPVDVSVNGKKIATWHVSEKKVYRAVIPKGLVGAPGTVLTARGATDRPDDPRRANLLIIDFYIPKAQAPVLIGASQDSRRLGIAAVELTVQEGADPNAGDDDVNATAPMTGEGSLYAFGIPLKFGQGENGGRYKLSGWHDAEPTYTWTGAQPAVLGLRIPKTNNPLWVTLIANGNILPPQLPTQPTELYANGQKVAEWQISGRDEFHATIPASALNPNGVLSLELRTAKATSPQALGVNNDARPLGIACYELAIQEIK